MLHKPAAPWETAFRAGILSLLAISILLCVYYSRFWCIGEDTSLMHYIVLLMQHGFAPYRDIIDMNMPGSYMVEWAAMRVFGMGDLAWRMFDLSMLALAALAAVYLAWPRGRFASALAALLLILSHFSGTSFDTGERDYSLAVMLIVGTAFLFLALRKNIAWPMAPFAALFGFAAAIKPFVALLPFLLLSVVVVHLRRQRRPVASSVAWAFAGALVPALAVSLFLRHFHAWHDYFGPIARLDLYHVKMGNTPVVKLLLRWLPWMFRPVALLALCVAWFRRREHAWDIENSILLTILVFGILGFFYQGKGWFYHASTAMFFVMVVIARVLARREQWSSASAMVVRGALALAILVPSVYLPVTLARHIQRDNDPVRNLMISDIQNLNDGSLSGHVQCLDWNSGCIGALYNLRLLPSTGFIYDFYLFPSKPAPITAELQSRFLAQVESAPPRMIILTSHDWPTLAQGFEKLDRWPAFHTWLDANYRLAKERHHPDIINGKPFDRAYRIYVLR